MQINEDAFFVALSAFESVDYQDRVVLINNYDGSVHSLDKFSSLVWRAFSIPRNLENCSDLFGRAFPDADREELREMLRRSISAMLERKWLVEL